MNDTTIAGFAAALAVPPVAEQERMVERCSSRAARR